MDRSWLSEDIYGFAYRGGKTRLLRAHQRMLERCAMTAGAIVIRCLPAWSRVKDSFSKRAPEEYLDNVAQLRLVYEGYEALQTELPMVTYNYGTKRLPAMPPPPVANRPGAGWWVPGRQILMVGDRTNTTRNQAETARVPFVAFDKLGCSAWLADELEKTLVMESQLYWVNSYRPDGAPEHYDWVDELQPRIVCLLGNRAEEWWSKKPTDSAYVRVVGKFPHPQHHKRFFHDKPYKLGTFLRRWV
jgi:hypothetical protein